MNIEWPAKAARECALLLHEPLLSSMTVGYQEAKNTRTFPYRDT